MEIISFNAETASENTTSENIIITAPEPEPEQPATGEEQQTETGGTNENEQISNPPTMSENSPILKEITKEIHHYENVAETVEISNNVVINPDDIVSVNTVSLNVISADGLSLNSVSLNISNNYISNNTVQILSVDSVPFWHKPFKEYTTSEGLLFIILITMTLGFISNHILRGLRNVNF